MSDVKVCPTCGSEYPVSERFCPRDGSALRGQNAEGDLTGTVIADRYHVMKKLGEGGMGTVYLAEHLKMKRKSALKVMNPGMSQDADAIARFNREASNASQLNHPNICAIYDFGETPDGLIYLAMEFIEGESLTSIIERDGMLAPARAASILHQAADGLQVAHDYGIVHRDLKPDNIMIAKGRDNSDVVKVVDFGIAKAHTSDAQKVTKTGLVVGTPEYMSPEQLAGDKLDGRSDIYSLALVGFNMLTGTLPFPSNSAQEAMIMRLTENPKTLAEMRPDVAWPADLQAVIDKALARDVRNRYAKASDFGREFSMAIEAMPAAAMADAGTVVLGAQAASPNAGTAAIPRTRVASDSDKGGAAPEAAPAPKKGKGMMIGGGALAIAAVALGMWTVLKPGSNAAKPGTTADSAAQARQDSAGKQPAAADAGKQPDSKAPATSTNPGDQRNKYSAPVNPSAPAGGGASGGAAEQPPMQEPTAKELGDLSALVDAAAADPQKAPGALQIANRLLSRAQGATRAEVLFRRASINFLLNIDDDACRDLKLVEAMGKTPILRAAQALSTTQSCPK